MELFWVIFWLLLLAVPALWLVSVIWGIVVYAFTILFMGIVWVIMFIVKKVKGE